MGKSKSEGTDKLGALEHRYGTKEKMAKEATPVALQKATDQKLQNPGLTMTKQTPDPIEVNPQSRGMQTQTVT